MTLTIPRKRGGRTVRTAVAIGAAVGLLALTSCEKPTPMATVTVGSQSVSLKAVCYDDGAKLSPASLPKCQRGEPTETVTVSRGDIVRVGVEPEMADPGWVMYVGGNPAVPEPVRKTYRSLNGDGFFTPPSGQDGQSQGPPPKRTEVTIAEQDDRGDVYGVWRVTIKLDD